MIAFIAGMVCGIALAHVGWFFLLLWFSGGHRG
jgi:hypothetical protein